MFEQREKQVNNALIELVTSQIPQMMEVFVGSAGKTIGLRVWTQFFGMTAADIKTDTLYAELNKIIDASLNRHDILTSYSVVQATANFINIDYENMKLAKVDKDTRAHELRAQLRILGPAMLTLCSDKLCHQAVNEIVLGINMHLALFKELACVDDKLDINSDGYANYLAYRDQYVGMLKQILDENQKKRVEQITKVERHTQVSAGEPLVLYEFKDGYTSKAYQYWVHNYPTESKAKEAADKARESLISELHNDMGYLWETVGKMESLQAIEVPPMCKSPEVGTPTSDRFDDGEDKWKVLPIDYVEFIHGLILDQFTVYYKDGTKCHHGGEGGGNPQKVNLHNERILKITGDYNCSWEGNYYLSNVCIVTDKGKYGPFGTAKGTAFEIEVNGCEVVSFFGSEKVRPRSKGIASLGVRYKAFK